MKYYMRRLPLHHGVNVRDLGGYPIDMHHMSAWNRCFRSDDPYAFDKHDYQVLKSLHVDRILDLRSLEEQQMSRCTCEEYGIVHVSLPFMKEERMQIPSSTMDQDAMAKFINSMKLDYVQMTKDAVTVIPRILEEIADSLGKGNSVLFHCTAGKDRTGIVACILLDLIGVPRYDILADYQVSATYNTEGVNQRMKDAMQYPQVQALFESRVEMMTPLIDFLHRSSCEEWLLSIGVSQKTIDLLREQLIETV